MAYQPMYAVVTDNQGYRRGTSCMRGKVNSVSCWVNSWFGEVLSVSARLISGRDLVSKPDLRKVKKNDRKQARIDYEEEAEKQAKVILDIEIPANKKFEVRINGFRMSYERIELLQELQMKRMDMQIEALKAVMQKDEQVLELVKEVMV